MVNNPRPDDPFRLAIHALRHRPDTSSKTCCDPLRYYSSTAAQACHWLHYDHPRLISMCTTCHHT